jgi:hypothetical protein
MKPLKVISLAELKKLNDEDPILRFRRSGKDKCYVEVREGWSTQPYVVENVSCEDIGQHLAVGDGPERVFLKDPGWLFHNQGLIGMLIFSVGIIMLFGPPKSKNTVTTAASIQDRVQELKRIQSSLTTLSDYVSAQRNTLQQTEATIERLKHEKGEVERALSIQRPQLDALLTAMNRDSAKRRWWERGWSFLIGFAASMLANSAWRSVSKKRRKSDNSETKT